MTSIEETLFNPGERFLFFFENFFFSVILYTVHCVSYDTNVWITHVGKMPQVRALVIGDDPIEQDPLRAIQLRGGQGHFNVVIKLTST